jgi:hypothetical protein
MKKFQYVVHCVDYNEAINEASYNPLVSLGARGYILLNSRTIYGYGSIPKTIVPYREEYIFAREIEDGVS